MGVLYARVPSRVDILSYKCILRLFRHPVASNLDAIISKEATCENLIPLYQRNFEANKTDSVWLKRAGSGNHKTRKVGQGQDSTGEYKAYQFGDPLEQIALTESIKNAQIRSS